MDIPFILEHVYDAKIEKVWQALTNEGELREWYFPQLKKFEPVVGYDFEFTDDGSNYKKEWRVTQVLAAKLFAHNWRYKGYPGSSEVILSYLKKRRVKRDLSLPIQVWQAFLTILTLQGKGLKRAGIRLSKSTLKNTWKITCKREVNGKKLVKHGAKTEFCAKSSILKLCRLLSAFLQVNTASL